MGKDPQWLKSSACLDSANCVEVLRREGSSVVLVRNSQTPDTVLEVPVQSWEAFMTAIRSGDLAFPSSAAADA